MKVSIYFDRFEFHGIRTNNIFCDAQTQIFVLSLCMLSRARCVLRKKKNEVLFYLMLQILLLALNVLLQFLHVNIDEMCDSISS